MERSRQFDGIQQQMFNVGEYDADGSWCQPKPALGYGEAFPRATEASKRDSHRRLMPVWSKPCAAMSPGWLNVPLRSNIRGADGRDVCEPSDRQAI